MKIAILSPFSPYRGGLAQFSDRLYTELIKTCEVQAFSYSLLYPSLLFPGKTQFVPDEEVKKDLHPQRLLNSINPVSYIKTAKAINQYSPDLLIIPYWISFLAPALGFIATLIHKKTKIFALVHNAIPHEPRFFDKPFAQFFFRHCDAFITLSNSVKKDLQKIVHNKNILVHEHPIYDQYPEKIAREEACSSLGISKETKNLLFFGFIREYKGLDLLIQAMAFLDGNYQLIIAGEYYDDFHKYEKLIEQSPAKKNIKVFNNYIPNEMVTTLFSAADALVLPYRSATQSGVLAIAYQLEVPVIVTNVGALGETVKATNIGVVAEKPTPEAVAEAIRFYCNDRERQNLFLKNIQKEKLRLSWKNFATSLLDFYERQKATN